MNKLFTKIVGAALGLTMAIGVGVAVGSNNEAVPVQAASPVEITLSTTGCTATSYNSGQERTWTQDGTSFGAVYLMKSSDNMQFQKTNAKVYNTTAMGGNITGITLTVGSGSAQNWQLKLGTSRSNVAVVSGYNASSTGWSTISGSYTFFEIHSPSGASYLSKITVTYASAKTLSGISVETAPTKTTYTAGEYFNPSGLVITRTYTDSTSDTYTYADHTSEFTFSPTTSTALTTSNTSVTITYGGKSTSQAITVTAPKTPASVSSSGHTTTFDAGDKFAYGGTLTATYTDSSSAGVTPTSFKIGNAGINPTSAGTAIVPGTTTLSSDDHNGKTVYVLYTENNTTVYTSYVITVNKISKITLDPTVTSSFPYQGITLTVTDGTLTNHTDYRVYKSQTMTITSTVGDMAKIEFTYSSASYDGGGWSSAYTPNAHTWTSPTANGEQARITKIIVTLASADPLVELDVSSAKSVSMMKGDPDNSIKVHVLNITTKTWTFTYDEGGNTGLSTSSYINVSAGPAVSDVHTLTITTKAVGSTTLHISVSGTACAVSIPVTVVAKPSILRVVESRSANPLVDITSIEIENGDSTGRSFTKLNIYVEDTDGNAIEIGTISDYVTLSRISGDDCVAISGGKITGKAVGTALVKFELNSLTSVFDTVTVSVSNDYKDSVKSITFNSSLTATQGQSVNASEVFATRVANTHFGSTDTIADAEFLFSYENNRSGAQTIGVFSYDFLHGSTVDSTHKNQTIYVFVTFDDQYSDSFTITIEQKNDPLTAITFTNVTSNAVDVVRGSTFQLEWAYTPTNPTDGKEVKFIIDDNSDGIDITVSESGLISIGAYSDLGDALVIIQSTHNDSIQDYVVVSAVLGTMKYTVSEAESWTKVTDDSTLSAGDVIMVASDAKGKVLGEFTGSNKYANEGTATFSDGSASDVTGALEFTLETGSSSGTWKLKNGTKYLYGTDTKTTLCLNDTATDVTITISSGNATIDFGSGCRILHNVNSTRFSNYTSDASSTMLLPQIYLKSGGDVEMDVTETLFNGVHNNFGAGKTYEWSETCSSFNSGNWLSACNALKGITGYSSYKLELAVADMNGNEIEVFLAKYDAIVNKFGTAYDHLGRFNEGGINHGARSVNPLQIVKDNGNTIAIVVATVVSMAAIGGYFFLRKRKEY